MRPPAREPPPRLMLASTALWCASAFFFGCQPSPPLGSFIFSCQFCFLSLCVFVSLSLCLSVSLSPSPSLAPSLPLSLSLLLSVSLSFSLSLSLSLSLSPSPLPLPLRLPLHLPVLSVSFFLCAFASARRVWRHSRAARGRAGLCFSLTLKLLSCSHDHDVHSPRLPA